VRCDKYGVVVSLVKGEGMPLTDLVKDPQVRNLAAPLLSAIPSPVGIELKSPLRRKGGGPLVGTAFDYAVRFELQRRYPNAVVKPWVAEAAILLGGMTEPGLPARWKTIVQDARSALAQYVSDPSPSAALQADIVASALRLARIDPFYRNGFCDPEPERVEAEDLADVLALVDMVPWERLGTSSLLWLNPSFGSASSRVGGADADIIAGDRLLDLKTTSKPTVPEDLRQLLGYLVLARAAREEDPSFPVISTLGIYHGRHGHLWTVDATMVASHPEFAAFETGLFKRADELANAERAELGIEKVATLGMTLDQDWMYYVKGDAVWRIMRQSARIASKSPKKQEKVVELKVKTDPSYVYFVDRDGDVSRSRAAHRRTEWFPPSETLSKNRERTKARPSAKTRKKASKRARPARLKGSEKKKTKAKKKATSQRRPANRPKRGKKQNLRS
jgi:hypothetical protein